MIDIEKFKKGLDAEAAFARRQLIAEARGLAQKVATLADRLEKDSNYCVSSVDGSVVNALCVRLETIRRVQESIPDYLAAEPKET